MHKGIIPASTEGWLGVLVVCAIFSGCRSSEIGLAGNGGDAGDGSATADSATADSATDSDTRGAGDTGAETGTGDSPVADAPTSPDLPADSAQLDGAPLDTGGPPPPDAAVDGPISNCPAGGYQPFDGDGVTAALNAPDGRTLLIFSRDKYWTFQWEVGWGASRGYVRDLWARFPAVGGARPWEGAGITAAWRTPGQNEVTVVSRDRYWAFPWPDGAVRTSGLLKDAWVSAPAADGVGPWEGPGVTAAYHTPDEKHLTIVSGHRYWIFTWAVGFTAQRGLLKDPWATIGSVQGRKPWEGPGVTAAWNTYAGGAPTNPLTIVSKDLFWHHDWGVGFRPLGGALKDVWATAPRVACP